MHNVNKKAETTPGKVTGGKYGEDLADESRSAKARDFEDKRKSYSAPHKEVQDSLKLKGGAAPDGKAFPRS